MTATLLHSPARIAALRSELRQARNQTSLLFSLVSKDTLYERPVPQRHRLIFYVGHVEAFDWNLLGGGRPRFQSAFDKLFEFGIDPDAGALPTDVPSDWPALNEVREYCREARRSVDGLLDESGAELIETAIEHRLMHAETLAYLLHNLPHNLKASPKLPSKLQTGLPEDLWLKVPAGVATLGRKDGFGWDNEFRAHDVEVPAFRIAKYKVTNGEFLEFVQQGACAPPFWEQQSGKWFRRGMFDSVPLPLHEPVYTSQKQATQYAAWRGKRLMTEAEFHRASSGSSPANVDFDHWDPIPVNAMPASAGLCGAEQLIGNGWEWTSTPFGPFPGFEPRPYYPGYSQSFFDGEHFVMKGGSARTAARLLRPSLRNWFRADYPYAYSAFRLVETA